MNKQHPAEWVQFPFLLVRRTCIARRDLDGIRYYSALALHDQADGLRERISSVAAEAIDRLHALVPQITDRAVRRTVLAAKRALFQGCALPKGEWLSKLERNSSLAAAIERYEFLQFKRDNILAARDADFDVSTIEKTSALLALLRTTKFCLALLIANRRLSEQLESIQIGGNQDKQRRQTLLRATRYLIRATFKPTPLSFFAATSITELGMPPPEESASPSWLSSVMPNRAIYRAISATLLAHVHVRAGATIFVVPTFFGDGNTHWVIDSAADRYREVQLNEELAARLIAAPRDGMQYQAFGTLTGLAPEALDDLVDRGVLTLCLGASDSKVDDCQAITRALWHAVPADLSVLALIDRFGEFESALLHSAVLDPEARMRALVAAERSSRSLPGIGTCEPLPPLAFEDTVTPERGSKVPHDWGGFVDEVVRFGAHALYPTPSPEEEALARLYFLIFPGDSRVPFLAFHRQYLEFCYQNRLDSDPETSGQAVYKHLNQSYRDNIAPIAADLEAAMATRAAEISYNPSITPTCRRPTDSARRRLSVRFAPTAPGLHGSRFHLLFWGSERMSLFPRYAQLPDRNADRLRDAFTAWMAQWPEVTDVYSSFGRNVDLRLAFTQRVIDGFDLPPSPNGIPLRELFVGYASDEGRLALFDVRGRRIRPVFFGVSARYRLPTVVRFLLFFSGAQTSVLEATSLALNRILLAAMRSPPVSPVHFPAVYLGVHTLLNPRTAVFDARRLPPMGPRVDRPTFFAFHDWLAAYKLPRLARAQSMRGKVLFVDLQCPMGVESFLRFVRKAEVVLLQPIDNQAVIRVDDEDYSVEFYTELSALS